MNLSLVKEVHLRLSNVIEAGDLCLDATAGNGLDTLFLAQHVGSTGTVHALDVQDEALRMTRRLLEQHGVSERMTTHLSCHSQMDLVLPRSEHGLIRATTFNLGYLPKGDKTIITERKSTLTALGMAYDWLRVGGILSVLCYRGHAGGKEEEEGVQKLIQQCGWKSEIIPGNDSSESPVLHWIEKT